MKGQRLSLKRPRQASLESFWAASSRSIPTVGDRVMVNGMGRCGCINDGHDNGKDVHDRSSCDIQGHTKSVDPNSMTRNVARFGACPLCKKSFPRHRLEHHASACTGQLQQPVEMKMVINRKSSAGACRNSDDNDNDDQDDDDDNDDDDDDDSVIHQYSSFAGVSNSEEITITRLGTCPLCDEIFPKHRLEQHASGCNGGSLHMQLSMSNKRPRSFCLQQQQHPENRPRGARELSRGALSLLPMHERNQDCFIRPTSEPLPGLLLFEDFLTEDEELQILRELDGHDVMYRAEYLPWVSAHFNGRHSGKRWGVHCNLRDRRVSAPEHPLPHFITKIVLPKIRKHLGRSFMMGCIPNEANAIDYRKLRGDFLVSHVDDRQLSKEAIANLSLAGDCIMTFRHVAKHRPATAPPQKRVLLRRRCLQILTGKARYEYAHGIERQDLLSDRRISVTMRESPLTTSTTSATARLETAT